MLGKYDPSLAKWIGASAALTVAVQLGLGVWQGDWYGAAVVMGIALLALFIWFDSWRRTRFD